MNELKRTNWGAEYDTRQSQYADLRSEVDFALGRALAPLKIHNYSVRIKTRVSFVEKIDRKRYTDPFSQMPDVVGGRIVCLFLGDLELVDGILHDIFDVKNSEDKTATSPPDTFSYRSVHYECMIKSDHKGPHYDSIKNLVFEIQVRTILQDAWAVVEHTLAYKGPTSIPAELRRDFSALVGLFHVADKTFQQLKNDIGESENRAASEIDAGRIDQAESSGIAIAIDRSTLKGLLRHMYSERAEAGDSDYSEFVEELSKFDITSIGQLRILLEAGRAEAANEEYSNPPILEMRSNGRKEYDDVGFARASVDNSAQGFRDARMARYF
ncbi:GTP pyrophosphokinase family protein [Nocardia tengchongensis]|uniref:GTP pyrophosphokinase n=1 Tax=Nocardia tengchongensis TaxID=2055889 RepID=UPI0036A527E9